MLDRGDPFTNPSPQLPSLGVVDAPPRNGRRRGGSEDAWIL